MARGSGSTDDIAGRKVAAEKRDPDDIGGGLKKTARKRTSIVTRQGETDDTTPNLQIWTRGFVTAGASHGATRKGEKSTLKKSS